MEVVHCDIGYGDTKSFGNGATYCMVFVDRATRYNWIYPLKSLTHTTLKAAISAWSIDAGQFPKRLYTDFDCKLLEGPTAAYLRENRVCVRGSPSGRQNQNGLVERAWQTIYNMGRAFITDMQMPRNYWYWALCQAVQVHNYVPCIVEGISTTPHELVYGVKPDLRILFRMFSTGFSNILLMALIIEVGFVKQRVCKALQLVDVESLMVCYSIVPIPNVFILHQITNWMSIVIHLIYLTYDMMEEYLLDCIFHHLFPLLLNHILKVLQSLFLYLLVSLCRELFFLVPILSPTAQLPLSDDDSPPYTVRLVDGSIHKVSPKFMDSIYTSDCRDNHGFTFPSWLDNLKKSCICTMEPTSKVIWNGTLIILLGDSHNLIRMVLKFLVSLYQIFVKHFRNK
jgi:hypothetical protein